MRADQPVVVRPRRRRGFVLPIVLAVLVVLTLAVAQLAERTTGERSTSRSLVDRQRAMLAAESGADLLMAMLAADPALDPATVTEWTFDLDERTGVTLVAAPAGGVDGLAAGIWSESGRLNLNTLAEADLDDELARLILTTGTVPAMPDEVADMLLDLIDADSRPRPLGDESGLSGVPIRNAPLETLDDVLLVPGVLATDLYGEDANANHLLDASEDDGLASAPPDNANGVLDLGWAATLTVGSREPNVQPDGTPKVNLNADDLEQLAADLTATGVLTAEQVDFILIVRKEGLQQAGGGPGGGPGGGGGRGGRGGDDVVRRFGSAAEEDQAGGGRGERRGGGGGREGGDRQGSDRAAARLETLTDLLTAAGDENQTPSPFVDQAQAMGSLWQVASLTDAPTLPGRVDLLAADPFTLQAIFETDEGTALSIADRAAVWTSPLEGLFEGLVDEERMKRAEPLVTLGSGTYRFQSIGFVENGPSVRIEFVVDMADPTAPRILSQRELSRVGLAVDRGVYDVAE